MKTFLVSFLFVSQIFSSQAMSQLPAQYQDLTALQKQKVLWQQIKSIPYTELPETRTGLGIGFILNSLKSFSTLSTSFDRTSDEMPKGRAKIIHPFGATAPIEWVAVENPFSGVFKTGGVGFARLSLAGDTDLLGFIPGMAIKILQNGRPSLNLHVMNSLDEQTESQNFFERDFSNSIDEPSNLLLQPLVFLFSQVQNPPTYLPITHFAESATEDINAPHSLIFEPTNEAFVHMEENMDLDFRTALSELPKNVVIYNVFAKKYSKSKKILVGAIRLKGSFVASKYQDQNLFFQHNR